MLRRSATPARQQQPSASLPLRSAAAGRTKGTRYAGKHLRPSLSNERLQQHVAVVAHPGEGSSVPVSMVTYIVA